MRRDRSLSRRLLICAALVSMACTLISCAPKKDSAPPPGTPVPDAASPAPAAEPSADKLERQASAQAIKRKVILNHAIALEVKDFSVTLESLSKLAESSGGYVFKSTRSGRDRGSVTGEVGIRVPTAKAGSALKGIRAMGRVESENSSAADITDEYVDMEARLKNARGSESRLLGLYNKAGRLADVLAVEKELTRVRGDIEAFEAKKKNWDILTEMVTIEVTLREPSGAFPSLHRSWNTIREGFGESADIVAGSLKVLILFAAAILPWLAIFLPLIYFFISWRRKRRRLRAGASETAEPLRKEQIGDN